MASYRRSREVVLARLLATPFTLDVPGTQARRRVGLGKILRWLEQQPGQSWQGVEEHPREKSR